MRNHHWRVGRNDYIQLKHVDAQGDGVQKGEECVFGAQAAAAAMAMNQ